MKYGTFILLFCVWSFTAGFCQSPTITIAAHWQKGDQKHYEISKTSSEIVNGKRQERPAGVRTAQLVVTDTSGGRYNISWKMEYPAAISSMMKGTSYGAFLKKFSELTYLYQTDKNGAFEQLLNQKDAEAAYRQAVDALMQSKEFINDSSGMAKGALSAIIGSSPNALTNALTQEIRLLHSSFGGTYRLGDSLFLDEKQALSSGQAAINSKSSVILSQLDTVAGTCVINYKTHPDPTSMLTYTKRMMEKVISESNYSPDEKEKKIADMRTSMQLANMEMVIEDTFHINYKQGWPTSIQNMRSVTVTDGEKKQIQEQKTTIKLID